MYPWAHEAWLKQHQMHWLPEEVPMADDVRDFNTRLTPAEKTLLTNIFRFFTQADIDVNSCYMNQYSKVFKPTEVVMMLTAFADMETMHIHAYSYLIETLNLPDHMYQEFLDYKEMREKHEYSASFNCDSDYNTALTLAAFGAFTEGLQLFGTFAVLMNFPRFNKMKGMGQIVEWSIRDETLHVESII
jgi:ribonucleoside-diphosphate reductase beta chain